jgi:hypothetical protein
MSLGFVLYIAAIAIGLGLLIRRLIRAQHRSPVNDRTVRRGDQSQIP